MAVPGSTLQRELLSTVSHRWLDAVTLRRAKAHLCGWSTAELLLGFGEADLCQADRAAMERAETHFQAALGIARQQQALGWELRAVISLSRLWRQQGRLADSLLCLQSVYARFGEGHGTADLVTARTIIAEPDRERT